MLVSLHKVTIMTATILLFKSAGLSAAMRAKIGDVGSKHREKMPASAFLEGAERKYPVKVKRDGKWAYSPKLLLAAARRARMEHRDDLADKADRIRTRLSKGGEPLAKAGPDKRKSNYGWKVGDHVAYVYRFYNGKPGHGFAEGTVTAVHAGTTRNNTTVSIRPAPGFHFGEGIITRHITGVHHMSTLSARANTPVSKRRGTKKS